MAGDIFPQAGKAVSSTAGFSGGTQDFPAAAAGEPVGAGEHNRSL
jgi:hypothetical protein